MEVLLGLARADASHHTNKYARLFIGPQEALITNECDVCCSFYHNTLVTGKHISKDDGIPLLLLNC